MTVEITEDLIAAGASGAGGWSAKQLEIIGVSWPPKKGWKELVMGNLISGSDAHMFVHLRSQKKGGHGCELF